MYERMLDKEIIPSIDEIIDHVGKDSYELLQCLEKKLNDKYDIVRELRFPYGNSYGWGFKYSHKTKHLCDVFFENDAITIMIQIGGNKVEKLNEELNGLLPKTKKLWKECYPCGNGGWIHYRVFEDKELIDVLHIIAIKQKPIR